MMNNVKRLLFAAAVVVALSGMACTSGRSSSVGGAPGGPNTETDSVLGTGSPAGNGQSSTYDQPGGGTGEGAGYGTGGRMSHYTSGTSGSGAGGTMHTYTSATHGYGAGGVHGTGSPAGNGATSTYDEPAGAGGSSGYGAGGTMYNYTSGKRGTGGW